MKLLLIDGNSVLFRAFYATCYGEMMKTSKGVYTNAVFAFANMLNKALNTVKPDYCVVAFDKGKHTFRHDVNPDYKGGRKEVPAELVPQFSLVREMLEAYNIPYLEYDDIEADDVIGTLAKKYKIDTCIFSSDHDLLQLIDDTTSVYVMKKGMSDLMVMNEKTLMEEYSLKPYQIIEYKALAGDKSDNIRGVDGIGEKTAVKLLNEYGNCENIYLHIDEQKGKLKEKLINGKESCFVSKFLATIKTDVDISPELDTFALNINEDTKNEFFKKYEMFSLIRKENAPVKQKDVKAVKSISAELLKEPVIYFVGPAFTYYSRNYFGVSITNAKGTEFISFEDFLNDKALIGFLESDRNKTVFDIKNLRHNLKNKGITIGSNTDDLMLMCFLSNNYSSDEDAILKNYNCPSDYDSKTFFGTEKKPAVLDEKQIMSYGKERSESFFSILSTVRKELEEKDMVSLYKDLELPLSSVLFEMEENGVCCDINDLDAIAQKTIEKVEELQSDIYSLVGFEFNIASPKQLKEVLYEKLDLPDLKKGSTNADVLSKLSSYHPVIDKILDFRKYSKLYSTYAEGLKKYISDDGKIHTVFSQTITQTGRLSSFDPNLQNISVRDEESREIRKAFKPGKGNILISSDYSQIELRVLASLANEPNMIDAFNSSVDIHTKTAMDVFGLKEEEVTPLVRRHAKAVNFGVVYGISDFGLANQTSLSFGDAKRFIEDYFKTYPMIKRYLDEQIEFCQKHGYVKTILNRRRYINEINDRNFMMREFGKRAAMNSTIQGSAADLIKIAMIKVSQAIKDAGLKSKLILQVHDELIFDVPVDEKERIISIIKDCMMNAYELKVRLESSLAIGETWYEAK